MDIKEIRWGNIIGSKLKPEGWRVYYTDFEFINENPDDYFGVPLSPEWLERFGFKGKGNSFTVRRVIIMPSNIENVEAWFTIYFDDGGAIYGSTKVYYVHQLQNLYFALTSEELELKP